MFHPYAGPIPPALGDLGALKQLSLPENDLTGELKSEALHWRFYISNVILEYMRNLISVDIAGTVNTAGFDVHF